MINAVIICGNLCRDPEIAITESGKKKASFTVAVNNGKRDGKELPPDYINCTAWEKTADFIESYFHKGDKAVVSGALKTRQYENQNGKQTFTYILAQSVDKFFGERKTERQETRQEPRYQQDTLVGGGQSVVGGIDENFRTVSYSDFKEDDLPFY